MPERAYDDKSRFLTFKIQGVTEPLLVQKITAREGVSTPFGVELRLLCERHRLPQGARLGASATAAMSRSDGERTFWNGVVNRLDTLGPGPNGLYSFRAHLVPQLWQLSLKTDCRIFQGKSVVEIVKQLLREQDVGPFEFRALSVGQEPRPYCVQYRESSLAFVSRLLEEEGIYYFFEHSEDAHRLVFADSPAQHPPTPCDTQVGLVGGPLGSDAVLEATLCKQLYSGQIALSDYNDQTPSVDLSQQLQGELGGEVYDFPGGYATADQGQRLARRRLEEQAALGTRLEGTSSCRGFVSGHRFTLREDGPSERAGAWVLVTIQHEASQSLSPDQADAATYENRFLALPHATPFRPPRLTPRPRIAGAQSAVVVGKAHEEIWTDSQGRVKVQFHWDRLGSHDENSSCWVRVAQGWAGKGYGLWALPRVGHEVLVEFMEGDPDRPIVTGGVHNPQSVPPNTLPANQTQTTFRSTTSKGKGYNELRVDDKSGAEFISLHAGGDLIEVVQRGHSSNVYGDQSSTVEGAQTLTVGESQTVEISGAQSTTVKGRVTLASLGGRAHFLKGDDGIVIEGKREQTVMGDDSLEVIRAQRKVSVKGGAHLTEVSEANWVGSVSDGHFVVRTVGGNIDLDAPNDQARVSASQIHIEAKASIVLAVGAHRITLDGSGILIESGASSVRVDGAGVCTQGPRTCTNATGLNELSGAVIKLN